MFDLQTVILQLNVSLLARHENGSLRGSVQLRTDIIYHRCPADAACSLCLILQFHFSDHFLGQIDQDAHFVYHLDIRPFQMVHHNDPFVGILRTTRVIFIVIQVRILLSELFHFILLAFKELLRILNKQ